MFQPEPISASASLTFQTVKHVINRVANVPVSLQISETMETTPAKQEKKVEDSSHRRAKGSQKIVKITPAERAYKFRDHGLIVSNAE